MKRTSNNPKKTPKSTKLPETQTSFELSYKNDDKTNKKKQTNKTITTPIKTSKTSKLKTPESPKATNSKKTTKSKKSLRISEESLFISDLELQPLKHQENLSDDQEKLFETEAIQKIGLRGEKAVHTRLFQNASKCKKSRKPVRKSSAISTFLNFFFGLDHRVKR